MRNGRSHCGSGLVTRRRPRRVDHGKSPEAPGKAWATAASGVEKMSRTALDANSAAARLAIPRTVYWSIELTCLLCSAALTRLSSRGCLRRSAFAGSNCPSLAAAPWPRRAGMSILSWLRRPNEWPCCQTTRATIRADPRRSSAYSPIAGGVADEAPMPRHEMLRTRTSCQPSSWRMRQIKLTASLVSRRFCTNSGARCGRFARLGRAIAMVAGNRHLANGLRTRRVV